MAHTQKKHPPIWAALCIGLSGAISVLFPPLLFVLPGLAAYLLLAGSAVYYAGAMLISGAISYAFAGLSGLWALAFCLPMSLALILLLQKKRPYFEAALILSGIAALGLYAMLGLPDALSGTKAFATMQQAFLHMWESSTGDAAAMPHMLSSEQLDLVRATGRQFAASLPVYMPMAIVALGALMGLFNTVIGAQLGFRAHADIRQMRPLSDWELPKSFTTGILFMGVGLILASLIGVSSMEAILMAVAMLAMIPFIVQGLAFFVFLLRLRGKSGNGLFIAAIVLLIFLVPLSVIFALTLLGAFEQFAHLRRRIRAQHSNKPD